MQVVAEYSFNQGKDKIEAKYGHLLQEIRDVLGSLDKREYIRGVPTDLSQSIGDADPERSRRTYAAMRMDRDCERILLAKGWKHFEAKNYLMHTPWASTYFEGYSLSPKAAAHMAHEVAYLDYVKEGLGLDLEIGRISRDRDFNLAQAMTVFRNLGAIDMGLLVVPTAELILDLSYGHSYYELFVANLHHRGLLNPEKEPPILIYGFY